MSAPPLPDIFGNYLLGEFVEVVSPASISWLPQTPGWAILGVILFALLLHQGWRRLQQWYRNRYRREAIARLAQIDIPPREASEGDVWLIEMNKLLKITALAAYPREQVARLSGLEWAEFLNQGCPEPPFSAEQKELLATGIYQTAQIEERTRQQLMTASLTWVRTHEGAHHV